jgi:GNAT superfamily N-acetyltransferase
VDTKVTFQKSLEATRKIKEIQIYDNSDLEREIEGLAYLSGKFSRFKIDSRLTSNEFKKLYKLWINKAFEKNQVLVTPEKAGMITFSVEKELGGIGLIAVSEKHQGLGWGKKLVKAAEYKCQEEGAKAMLIPTQESNVPACKLYESLGYKPAERVYVYHYWND